MGRGDVLATVSIFFIPGALLGVVGTPGCFPLCFLPTLMSLLFFLAVAPRAVFASSNSFGFSLLYLLFPSFCLAGKFCGGLANAWPAAEKPVNITTKEKAIQGEHVNVAFPLYCSSIYCCCRDFRGYLPAAVWILDTRISILSCTS